MFDRELGPAPSIQGGLASWLRTYLPGVLGISIWVLLVAVVFSTVLNPLGRVFAQRTEPTVQPSIPAAPTDAVATRNGPAPHRQ